MIDKMVLVYRRVLVMSLTLVFGLATHTFVQQVGDRKLTKGTREHDPQSNKSVIMLGSDGFICVSYSGLAYIQGKNTDLVLAELMAETKARPGRRPGTYVMAMGGQNASRVGLAISRLKHYLDSDFPRTIGRNGGHTFQLLITGFLGEPEALGRHVRPYVGRFDHKLSKNSHSRFQESPRAFPKDGRQFRAQIGQTRVSVIAELHEYLDSSEPKGSGDTLRAMRKAIEDTSRTNRSVGPDCLGITMSRWGHIYTTYMPQPTTDSGQTCYTPWLISRNGFIPPQVITGNEPAFSLNGYTVGVGRIPPLQPSHLYTSGGQVRPGP